MYIESICGDCHRFVANELKYIALHPELLDYVDLRLHIFGKARILSRSPPSFACQFGERGCTGNKALNCIYKHSPSFTEAIKVMECIYETGYSSEDSISNCYAKFGGDSSDAVKCFKSSEADMLLMEAGDHSPSLRWVPAFQSDGPIRVDTRNFVQYICSQISGTKPLACNQKKYTVGIDPELLYVSLKQFIFEVKKD